MSVWSPTWANWITFGQTSLHAETQIPVCTTMRWTGWAIPNVPWRVSPTETRALTMRCLIPSPLQGNHSGHVCLAADTVGVKILSRESRSVGHPRSVYMGRKLLAPGAARPSESQERGMASQAGQGIEDTVWHRCSGASWVQHGGRSPVLSPASLKNTARHPKMKDRLKGNGVHLCQSWYFFHCNFNLWPRPLTCKDLSAPTRIKPTPSALSWWV